MSQNIYGYWSAFWFFATNRLTNIAALYTLHYRWKVSLLRSSRYVLQMSLCNATENITRRMSRHLHCITLKHGQWINNRETAVDMLATRHIYNYTYVTTRQWAFHLSTFIYTSFTTVLPHAHLTQCKTTDFFALWLDPQSPIWKNKVADKKFGWIQMS